MPNMTKRKLNSSQQEEAWWQSLKTSTDNFSGFWNENNKNRRVLVPI